MKEASPIVNAGSRMCQPITQANCRRERISGSSLIGSLCLYRDARITFFHLADDAGGG
jgi:hypothetical protein